MHQRYVPSVELQKEAAFVYTDKSEEAALGLRGTAVFAVLQEMVLWN